MATYYIATNGSDNYPGTLAQPFLTWAKISDVSLYPGDTVYIRGGTYTKYTPSAVYQCRWHHITGTDASMINIWAYPGETPVWDLTGITLANGSQTMLQMFECDYLHIKGLTITGITQPNLSSIVGWNLTNSAHNIIEQCIIHHAEIVKGFSFCDANYDVDIATTNSSDNLFLNCDVYVISDPLSYSPYGGSNGFENTWNSLASNITYINCRAWMCSDDGWDLFRGGNAGILLQNCWSFWNGYSESFVHLGDGCGYKLGPAVSDMASIHAVTLENCIAARNYNFGFNQNSVDYSWIIWYYNTISYYNGYGYNWFGLTPGPEIVDVLKNNIAYANTVNDIDIPAAANDTYNSWNPSTGVTVTNADFITLSVSELSAPRKSDGSLPDVSFGHLVANSDLRGAGIKITGLTLDGAGNLWLDPPSLGPYEYSYSLDSSVLRFVKVNNKYLKMYNKFVKF